MTDFMFAKVANVNFTDIHNETLSNSKFSTEPHVFGSSGTNCSPPTPISFAIGYVVFALPGLFFNTLFILTVVRQRSMRKPLTLTMMLSFGDWLLAGFVLTLGINNLVSPPGPNNSLTRLACFYRRPYLSIFICGTLLHTTANLLVAIERSVAILKPYQFYKAEKTNAIYGICICTVIFVVVTYVAGITVTAVQYSNQLVYNGLCFPGTVVNDDYSGFLYVYSVLFGFVSITCYVGIFGFIFYKKYLSRNKVNAAELSEDGRHDSVQRKRQIWLLKVCSILTLNTFLFIVIPYGVLFVTRSDTCPTNVLYFIRRYVSYLLAVNSFSGMIISLIASKELRTAMVAMFRNRTIRNSVSSTNPMKLARLSSTKATELDSANYRTVTSMH